ncbi:hypothetical protein ACFQBQ_04075 [Granulicella cerasi]|uniref:Cardiolipin synthase N-terminal domain-containing protein n=1 Tax=Granulicella cerasi TaxID=741063 RepID=A0ABW1Z8G7_9BACT
MLLLLEVIWPFRIASAARRKGGNFNAWLVCATLLNGLLVGLAYYIRYRDRPILQESA